MKIKICGLMRPEDGDCVNRVKPDYAGMILSPGFRRSISDDMAKQIRARITEPVRVVGVFVNEAPERVIEWLEEGVIDLAQLHGEESEEEIQYIQAVTHKPVIKAVKVLDRYDVEAWLDSSADYLLFDSGTGTGKTFDWDVLRGVTREYFLAGGVGPDNMESIGKRFAPYAVDLSSSVETDGQKDPEKINAVVALAHSLTDRLY